MMIQAFFMNGRWLVKCPKCNNIHRADGNTLVCPACWTGLNAQKIVIDKFGAMVPAPHVEMIFETRDKAIAAGELYEIAYPANKAEIEHILRVREIENMSWLPGESIEQLIQENIEHGLEAGL